MDTTYKPKHNLDGIGDPDFWAWFKSTLRTEEEQAWHEATRDRYQDQRQAAYDAAKADIVKGLAKTKTKKFTKTHHERAISVARGIFGIWVTKFERETEEHDGVFNPYFGKVADEWGAMETPEDLTDLAAWLAEQTWSSFAVSLAESFQRNGELSYKQVTAAKSMRAKCEAREKAREEEAARLRKLAEEEAIDLGDLPSGLYAVPSGDTRLKVRVSRSIKDSASGRYPRGTIFVNDDAAYGQRKMYGSQKPDGVYMGDIGDALKAILVNPFEARTAYGRLVGRCGECGRRLEDKDSIAAGIGPVCAAKWAV